MPTGGKKGGIDLGAGKSSQKGTHSCRGEGAGGEHVAQRPLQVPRQKLYVVSCEHAEMGKELTEVWGPERGKEHTKGKRGPRTSSYKGAGGTRERSQTEIKVVNVCMRVSKMKIKRPDICEKLSKMDRERVKERMLQVKEIRR